MTLTGRRILLIVGGGIAAYKCLDLVRRLRERGAVVTPVMTPDAAEFVTPLSLGALTGARVYGELFDRDDEHDVGHIRLAREADLVILAPASATRMAKMAAGIGDDLAGAILLATATPVLAAPAMNPAMWRHPATRRSAATLAADGIRFVGPNRGEMAERGEAGEGRMAEPLEIVAAAEAILSPVAAGPLAGRHVVVTSGPTHEPIDPVRYIANRSSGRQGHAIAGALARAGARVTLVSGPVALPDPAGVSAVHVETARQMLAAVEAALPADAAVFVAAVADWRTQDEAGQKMKKGADGPPHLALIENPDILRTVGTGARRPALVVGFAAETSDLLVHAGRKLAAKGADLIVANDVSEGTGVMGGTRNTVRLVSAGGVEDWPELDKREVAERLVAEIARRLSEKDPRP
ncbi:bifunctional phosphopantothenoylcysteine decarboxylase/phosphopantothenate--cysteine ligase CoaBC [Aureimonas sp. AU12]|uniref:bifunctional phosphopantothenoylcysteine decarboxylase/phosphopantothenate--cysteine ligase CoaBC n=1 Tax=Aureimonas sp. AU12 TaxID=1638161 RepID=UPI0007068492|nr:bifunctional phosphopantothenoylcysteine decarboxylase/phosphopantothenate--cysteine ligase CoaBC [Aureimonas sp. AU12]BAT29776.1 bifunctional phosphopantothenoylcysteine decarboxylase/phosphopantothenate synthase [Aureimonas sp. AU12]